jgi:hypothetical protein
MASVTNGINGCRWATRNDYIKVILDRSRENIEDFLSEHANKQLSEAEKRRAIKLLEMQRHGMLMFTSCGWFFDEISGIETVQVMMYAARAIQLAEELFVVDLEPEYIRILEQAPSNITEFLNGAKIYKIFVAPSVVDFIKISAQNTIRELFADNAKTAPRPTGMPNCCFRITPEISEKWDDGKFRFIINRSTISSSTTLDEQVFSSAAVWLGDHNVTCGARSDMPSKVFKSMRNKLVECFDKGQINEIIVGLSKYFGQNNYSLKDLFKDDQRYILWYIVADGLKKAKELYEIVYHDNSAMLRFMKENRIPSPKPLQSAAEIVLNMELERILSAETTDLEKLRKLINDSQHLSITFDSLLLGFLASERIDNEFNKLSQAPENLQTINAITGLIRMIKELPIQLNLWESQNIAFKIAQSRYQTLKQKDDETSKLWIASFAKLCELVGIRLA